MDEEDASRRREGRKEGRSEGRREGRDEQKNEGMMQQDKKKRFLFVYGRSIGGRAGLVELVGRAEGG